MQRNPQCPKDNHCLVTVFDCLSGCYQIDDSSYMAEVLVASILVSCNVSTETIPFFQAVYHQYGITYGSYSSLVTPPFEELWPKEHAPDFQEQPLDDVYDQQF